jgi:hypothetical protein
MKIKLILLSSLLFLSLIVNAQDKPFRIGVKLGLPNIAGAGIEYVTPLVGQKLAIYGDFSLFSPTIDDVAIDFTYFEGGLNYYFFKEGRSLYGSLSYGQFNSDFTYQGLESDDGSKTNGEATASYSYSSVNVKIGAKLGGGFYFRPEIGYALTPGKSSFDIVATFPDGSTESQSEEIPAFISGGLIFNIGIGVAF